MNQYDTVISYETQLTTTIPNEFQRWSYRTVTHDLFQLKDWKVNCDAWTV